MSDTDIKPVEAVDANVAAIDVHVAGKDEMNEEMHEWLQSAPLLKLLDVPLTRDKRPKKQRYAKLNGPYGYRDMNPYYLRFYKMTHDTDDGIESYVLGIESTTLNDVPGGLQLQKNVILSDTHDFYYLIDRFFRDYVPARRLAIIGSALETTIPIPPLVNIIVEYSNEPWLTELASMFLTVQTDHTPQNYKSVATSDTRLFSIQDDCICCS